MQFPWGSPPGQQPRPWPCHLCRTSWVRAYGALLASERLLRCLSSRPCAGCFLSWHVVLMSGRTAATSGLISGLFLTFHFVCEFKISFLCFVTVSDITVDHWLEKMFCFCVYLVLVIFYF